MIIIMSVIMVPYILHRAQSYVVTVCSVFFFCFIQCSLLIFGVLKLILGGFSNWKKTFLEIIKLLEGLIYRLLFF